MVGELSGMRIGVAVVVLLEGTRDVNVQRTATKWVDGVIEDFTEDGMVEGTARRAICPLVLDDDDASGACPVQRGRQGREVETADSSDH
ncbi:MAG: hypothetical protein U5Q44_10650 [Dehalococcoidia bacterium]|nr:hypothetical protein [Dehalococcoidia bacterium]